MLGGSVFVGVDLDGEGVAHIGQKRMTVLEAASERANYPYQL